MAQMVLITVTKWKNPQRRNTRMEMRMQRRCPLLGRLTLSLPSVQLKRRRKRWRQKSRRQRKMEIQKRQIQKRQKWRLRSLPCFLFAALSDQPGQHCVVELVLSVPSEKFLFVCSHVTLHWSPET